MKNLKFFFAPLLALMIFFSSVTNSFASTSVYVDEEVIQDLVGSDYPYFALLEVPRYLINSVEYSYFFYYSKTPLLAEETVGRDAYPGHYMQIYSSSGVLEDYTNAVVWRRIYFDENGKWKLQYSSSDYELRNSSSSGVFIHSKSADYNTYEAGYSVKFVYSNHNIYSLASDVSGYVPGEKVIFVSFDNIVDIPDGGIEDDEVGSDSWYQKLYEKLQNLLGTAFEILLEPLSLLSQGIQTGFNILQKMYDWLIGNFFANFSLVVDGVISVKDFALDNLKNSISYLKLLYEWLIGKFFDNLTSIVNGIISIRSFLAEKTGGISETLINMPALMWSFFLNGLQELFVPSEDFFSNKLLSLRERFSFVDSVLQTVESFRTFFTNVTSGSPPKFSVNMKNVDSKYNWGGEVYIMDFSWYEPYKPWVDKFLASVLWFFFVWNTWKDLPNIINGVSTAFNTISRGDF